MNLECANCGERNHPPGAVYCLNCGAALPGPFPAPDPDATTETMVLDPPMGQLPGSDPEPDLPRFRFAFRPLAVMGALALGVSGALAWIDTRTDFAAWDLPLENLAGDQATADWLNVGLVLAVVAGAGLVFAFLDLWYSPFRWMGLAALGFVAWFAEWVGLYSSHADDAVKDIGIGPYVAIAGVLLLVLPQWTAARGGETREPRLRGPGVAAILVPFIVLGSAVSWAYVTGEDPRDPQAAPVTTESTRTPSTTVAPSEAPAAPATSGSPPSDATTSTTAATRVGDELLLAQSEIEAIDSCTALADAAVQHLTATAVKLSAILTERSGDRLLSVELKAALGDGLTDQGDRLVDKGLGLGCSDAELAALVRDGMEAAVIDSEETRAILELLGPPAPAITPPDAEASES